MAVPPGPSSSSSSSEAEATAAAKFPVYLIVYDDGLFNWIVRWIGLAYYFTVVQVHGRQFSLRVIDEQYAGFSWLPRYDMILIGHTHFNKDQVVDIARSVDGEFSRFSLRLNSFTNNLCDRLTGNGIPFWVDPFAFRHLRRLALCVWASLGRLLVVFGGWWSHGPCRLRRNFFCSEDVEHAS